MNFIKKYNILTRNQFGFRPNHSTQLALFKVLTYIVENVDKNEKVAGLFFDLSKAFDTIDHQILLKILSKHGIRDMNRINLLIFDECHKAVGDSPMRQIMKNLYGNLREAPRVIGLTATLLNGNCSPLKVHTKVYELETTFHSKVATVDELSDVIRYSTNPREKIILYQPYSLSNIEETVSSVLKQVQELMQVVDIEEHFQSKELKPLKEKSYFKKMSNCMNEVTDTIRTMGTYGAVKAIISLMIKFERIKRYCTIDIVVWNILSHGITVLQFVMEMLLKEFQKFSKQQQIFSFSSDKMLKLFQILGDYSSSSNEELCGLIFTKERSTAKILHHVLRDLSEHVPEFRHIKSDFIVGYNGNPFNSTVESLLINKKNRQVLDRFRNKEINVLVASNVLEEGVDVPTCTMVVRFDRPMDYRSYVQSKGRARHKDSLFYIMVDAVESKDFESSYLDFKAVEQKLKDLLIGKNKHRRLPDEKDIKRMYDEDELPPYYVNGPGSAQINMQNAIALLCHYYASLPSDEYTTYAPEWFSEERSDGSFRVVIHLPTVCPVLDVVIGQWTPTLKAAKEAAAYEACIMLFKAGVFDEHLRPIKIDESVDDIKFLFSHYPEKKEKHAGTSKMKRLHKIQVPSCVRGQLRPGMPVYLHIISLNPRFPKISDSDINEATMYDNYVSSRCYGFLTPERCNPICSFPIFVTMGQINVHVEVNKRTLVLDEDQLAALRHFHCSVFRDVLKVLQKFLIFDCSDDAETVLLVPVNKLTDHIDFDVVRDYSDVREVTELTQAEKVNLQVTKESHHGKIVSPWYRSNTSTYVVTEVCLDRNACSNFPNDDYVDFREYYIRKHDKRIENPTQPLLLVKGLTQRLNFVKPKGKESKRKHEKLYEELTEYLIPELVVKQDFPSSLWIQACMLPTILSKVLFCFQLEDLRQQIARESGLGDSGVSKTGNLELDMHLLYYEPDVDATDDSREDSVSVQDVSLLKKDAPPVLMAYNKDYAAKKLEGQYPWKDADEPTKDLERDLDVTLMDIECYEGFISAQVQNDDIQFSIDSPVKKQRALALTYYKDYSFKDIKLLDDKTFEGPELSELYRALTTAKANDIVNLERLETLGDSFLKIITSVYISINFPHWNEGQATALKGRIVSNKNLFYLARKKNLVGIIRYHSLDNVKHDWLPPCFALPQGVLKRIERNDLSLNALFNLDYTEDKQQESGILSDDKLEEVSATVCPPDDTEDHLYNSMASFLKCQYIGDKHVSDTVESLLGCYFVSCGFAGGMKFVEWMEIIPDDLSEILMRQPENPFLVNNATLDDLSLYMPCWQKVEEILGYTFKNKGYILQAFTHASYTPNRLTRSYERLEFLGDAILDFLITCYIYEQCEGLTPGLLTDLRAALVNNNTFASLLVRLGLHKFILFINQKLQAYIDRFVEFLEDKRYQIDDEVLILLDEDELLLAEQLDVPKALGDVFEALAGAVYLDSGKDLKTVWRVFHKIMWNELELFSQNVPKNSVKRLYEWHGAHPQFGNVMLTQNSKVIVPLQFLMNGVPKLVHGCGANKMMAKKAAAKLALRFLDS
ncbi:unnamed protein product [Acanthoscelides obtectus]|uniref:Dicer-2 n=1 Tax=Acanthoscelides obtectus TaxID=200917 RepID=A0A9P0NZH6_ACAOB|nr:unnamed protein product [Acanthoscelides obtectus]CAK1631521.1 Endoribonuclease Dicer [Acanthoscelides obtectus]